MRGLREQLRLYAVTDRTWLGEGENLWGAVAQAIAGGATFVQLREKTLTGEALLAEARALKALCREAGVPFVVNDDVALALAVDADGVHLGQEDMAVSEARAMLGEGKLIGVSAHNPEEALAAERAGADYLGCGAAFVTGTKGNAKPITRETLSAVTAAVSIPVVAIGGIGRENVLQLAGCGLAGVAVVSGIFAQKDIRAASAELYRLAGML